MWLGTIVVTLLFYYILEYFNTANIIPGTISVTTSFLAVYLTFRRSPYFALAYATNDIVLIVLWILASMYDVRYISVAVCFVAFWVNDIYGFINWRKMKLDNRKMKLCRKSTNKILKKCIFCIMIILKKYTSNGKPEVKYVF